MPLGSTFVEGRGKKPGLGSRRSQAIWRPNASLDWPHGELRALIDFIELTGVRARGSSLSILIVISHWMQATLRRGSNLGECGSLQLRPSQKGLSDACWPLSQQPSNKSFIWESAVYLTLSLTLWLKKFKSFLAAQIFLFKSGRRKPELEERVIDSS